MLEQILQHLSAGNPQLAQLISQNPDQFLSLLGEDAGEDEAPLPPGAQAIAVTPEERDAIERVSTPYLGAGILKGIRLADGGDRTVMPSRLRPRRGDPGLLRVRQERGARRQLPVRPARRGRAECAIRAARRK